jgi:ADP-ribose pyrophosphatase
LERKLESRLINEGRYFSFRTDVVELPSGRRTRRDIVRHPGAVAIIPVLSDGRLVLVRQYRYAAGKSLLELLASTLEPGEKPLACACRELREETGYKAGEMRRLLSCFMAPGYSSEVIHFFEARGLRYIGDDLEPDEEIETETIDVSEARGLIEENAIEDAKTIIGILLTFPQAKA